MKVSSDITHLITLAIDTNENSQIQFADGVTQIVEAFPPKIINEQFLPFLVNWLPRNNQIIASSIVDAIPAISEAAGGISKLVELIDALISSENNDICSKVFKTIEDLKGDNDDEVVLIVKRIAKSKYDLVRKYAIKLLDLVESNDTKAEICLQLASDTAFLVRIAVAEYIPKMDEKNAENIARELMVDHHARIRAYLPIACSKMGFFYSLIVEKFINDKDWSVRASLANNLVDANDHVQSCKVVTKLISDKIWQVKLCALRTLTSLLNSTLDLKFTDGLHVLSLLSNLIQTKQYPLKIAVIDCFFAISNHCKNEISIDKLQSFVDHLVLLEKPNIKLHFIELIANSKDKDLSLLVQNNIGSIIDALSQDEQWRVRLGVVKNLHLLYEMIPEATHKEEYYKVCVRLAEDEAFPVRIAAIQYLAKYFISEGNKIPDSVKEMKTKDSFRKRQIALQIMDEMKKLTDDIAFKEELLTQMKSFQNDECINVALLAKQLVEAA